MRQDEAAKVRLGEQIRDRRSGQVKPVLGFVHGLPSHWSKPMPLTGFAVEDGPGQRTVRLRDAETAS